MNTLLNDRRTIDTKGQQMPLCVCGCMCVCAMWHHYDTHVPNKSYKITISISANLPNAFANLLSWPAAVGCGACCTRSIGLERAQIVFSREIEREWKIILMRTIHFNQLLASSRVAKPSQLLSWHSKLVLDSNNFNLFLCVRLLVYCISCMSVLLILCR